MRVSRRKSTIKSGTLSEEKKKTLSLDKKSFGSSEFFIHDDFKEKIAENIMESLEGFDSMKSYKIYFIHNNIENLLKKLKKRHSPSRKRASRMSSAFKIRNINQE